MKKYLFTLIMLCLAFLSMAQDTSVVADGTSQESTIWLILGFALATLELVFRLVPTTKDISILSWIYRILSAIIPNRAAEEKAVEASSGKISWIRKQFKIKAD